MSRRQNSFQILPQTPKKPIRDQKSKNDPKIKSKSKVRIERNRENESCSTTWVDLKTVFETHNEPNNSPLGPQKVKNNPKIKSKQKPTMNYRTMSYRK